MKIAVKTFRAPVVSELLEAWLNSLPGEVMKVDSKTYYDEQLSPVGTLRFERLRVIAFYKEVPLTEE